MFQKLIARKRYKNIRQYIILLIMNHQPANFWGDEKLPGNLWKDPKAEGTPRI